MKKISGFLLLLCLVLNAIALQAQYYNGKQPGNSTKTNHYKSANTYVEKDEIHFRWYPLGLVNTSDLNFTVGTEYSYANNKSVIVDAGYIMASIYGNEDQQLFPATGYIVKTAHRWYYGKRRKPTFFDAEATFKHARYKSGNQWVGRGVVEGVPAYEELMEVTSKKDVFTLGARMGKSITFSPTSPLGMEFWWGLGIRYRHYYPDLPDDAQILQGIIWFFNPMDYDESWLPDLQLGVRLTWKANRQ